MIFFVPSPAFVSAVTIIKQQDINYIPITFRIWQDFYRMLIIWIFKVSSNWF